MAKGESAKPEAATAKTDAKPAVEEKPAENVVDPWRGKLHA